MKQLSMFNFLNEEYKIPKEKKLRLISLFSGYDSQALALKYANIPFEHYHTCEWTVSSIQALKDIHFENDTNDYSNGKTFEEIVAFLLYKGISIDYNNPMTQEQINRKGEKWVRKVYNNIIATKNLVNVSNVCGNDLGIEETDKYEYLLTYSFPCQDLSLAGTQKGMNKNDKTRSALLWEVERILKECKNLPNILLMENVPQVLSVKNVKDFVEWQKELESLGYKNYFEQLNAKDYGIPQNRNRVFMISVLGDYFYDFPQKQKLKLKIKDLLEEEVDEKYYLSQKMLNCFMADGTGKYPRRERFLANIERENQDVGNAVTTLAGNRATDNFVVEGYGNKRLNETLEQNEVEDSDFIDAYNKSIKKDVAGTITTRVSDSNCTFIAERNKKQEHCDDLIEKGLVQDGDIVNHSRDYDRPVNANEPNVAPTLTTRADELGVVVPLKCGYDVEVKPEKDESDGIDVIGNYSKSKFNQTSIVGKNGIAPTVTENHGQVTTIAIKNNTKQGYLLAEEGDGIDISSRMKHHRGTVQKGMCQTITTSGGNERGVVVKERGASYARNFGSRGKLQNVDNVCDTLVVAMGTGGGNVPIIKESLWTETQAKMINKDGNIKRYIDSKVVDEFKEGQCADISFPNGYNKGPRVHEHVPAINATTTISSFCVKTKDKQDALYHLRIRKLTPKECWRLMGVKDEDFEKVKKHQTNVQLYHLAGDSIVTNVLVEIFKKLVN